MIYSLKNHTDLHKENGKTLPLYQQIRLQLLDTIKKNELTSGKC